MGVATTKKRPKIAGKHLGKLHQLGEAKRDLPGPEFTDVKLVFVGKETKNKAPANKVNIEKKWYTAAKPRESGLIGDKTEFIPLKMANETSPTENNLRGFSTSEPIRAAKAPDELIPSGEVISGTINLAEIRKAELERAMEQRRDEIKRREKLKRKEHLLKGAGTKNGDRELWEEIFRNETKRGDPRKRAPARTFVEEPSKAIKLTLWNLPKFVFDVFRGRANLNVKGPVIEPRKVRKSGVTIRKEVPLSRIGATKTKEDWRKLRVDRLKQLKLKVKAPLITGKIKSMSIGRSAKILENAGKSDNGEKIKQVLLEYQRAMVSTGCNNKEEFERRKKLAPHNSSRNRLSKLELSAKRKLNALVRNGAAEEVLAAYQVFWLYAPKKIADMR